MGMSSGDDSGVMSEINVTPFVDVMLVLLIIFMVTAPMMNQGLEVDLPDANANALPADTEDDMLTLSITENGQYFINKREILTNELEAKLMAISEANPDQAVYLKADANVPYEKVAQLMAACTQAGITKIGMVTEPGVDQ
ncbi:MAG: protein TolR [Myxococcota bacterium]|nr:protein TolR [Myxococcota bacterium]